MQRRCAVLLPVHSWHPNAPPRRVGGFGYVPAVSGRPMRAKDGPKDILSSLTRDAKIIDVVGSLVAHPMRYRPPHRRRQDIYGKRSEPMRRLRQQEHQDHDDYNT
jgi:hypothetical protein